MDLSRSLIESLPHRPRSKSFSLSNMINNKIGRQAHLELLLNGELGYLLAWIIHRYKILQDVDHAWI